MKSQSELLFMIDRLQRRAGLVGLAFLGISAVGAFTDWHSFAISYLFAYLVWLSVALGALGFLMMQFLTGGLWGVGMRRLFEAASRTLLPLAGFFVPILLAVPALYPWAAADADVPRHYLNPPFFVGRALFYFAVWTWIARRLSAFSREHDQSRDPSSIQRARNLSGPGLVVFGITTTFAAIDWVMSLEPHWKSTVFGMVFTVGMALSGYALLLVIFLRLLPFEPFATLRSPKLQRDVGNILLATVMIWAYLSFIQYLVVWMGNLPDESTWYLHRIRGGWLVFAVLMVVCQFFLPFFSLLFRGLKDRPRWLAGVALWVFFLRAIELYWYVVPSFYPQGFHFHWTAPFLVIGFGGAWTWLWVRELKQCPLLPAHEVLYGVA